MLIRQHDPFILLLRYVVLFPQDLELLLVLGELSLVFGVVIVKNGLLLLQIDHLILELPIRLCQRNDLLRLTLALLVEGGHLFIQILKLVS